jgi:hypothetical protein
MAPAANPYEAKQAQQQYPVQHQPLQQYGAQNPQPFDGSQPYPAQPLQQQQQQPKRGNGIAGKLSGMFKSKMNMPS